VGRLAVYWQACGGVDLSSFVFERFQRIRAENVDSCSNVWGGWGGGGEGGLEV
jgi:hypothetical protein